MLLEPMTAIYAVDTQVLGVQKLLPVQVDVDPGVQQLLVVRLLRQAYQNLVGDPGNHQVDLDAAPHCRLQRHEQRVVRDEVRAS